MKKIAIAFLACVLVIVLCSCVSPAIANISEETLEYQTDEESSTEVPTGLEKFLEQELLSSASTNFDPTNVNRKNNIELAGNIINGTILQPGQEFSFNNIVGERTAERGFLPAGVFVNVGGKTITRNGIGGGICQVSSTIYMSVLNTSIKVIERNEHSKRVSYTTRDKEAMVNWGTSDLKFENTYEFPIKIEVLFQIQDTYETISCNIYLIK